MSLLGLIPWYWRWLAIVGAFAACFGYGFVKGYGVRDRSADLEEAKVEALGDAARQLALERKAKQDQTTKEIRNEHASDVARIHRFYARKLRGQSGGGPVPAAAERAFEPDGAPAEPTSCGESPQRDIAFERACALDAEQVMKWQEFARRNNFPIQ